MKIASWNVNSVRARLGRVLGWLEANRPDVLCLQETKCTDDMFPAEPLRDAGYEPVFFGQKSYNGVAVLARSSVTVEARGFADGEDDLGARFLMVELEGVLVASVYVPNGRAVGTEYFAQKLAWLRRLRAFLEARTTPEQPLLLCGDFNVTPDDRDVWDPEALEGTILCHPDERAALAELEEWGLSDTFRLHEPEPGHFSWWDYRQLGFPKNRGLRIDLILATEPLTRRCVAVGIDREARKGKGASDHVPVWAELS